MPTVEGLSPEILWYTLIGLVGLGSLIVLGDKVADVFRRRRARQQIENTPSEELADNISERVLERMEPRLAEIDRKLDNDKQRLDAHERQINAQGNQINAIEHGQKVQCRGILALLSHEINGNSDDKLKESQEEITNFLIDR